MSILLRTRYSPAGIYLFKLNYRNTRTRCEICSNLTKTPEQRQCLYVKWNHSDVFLKVVSAIFYQVLVFHRMIALQKLSKMFFLSSKKFFSFLRYLSFCILVFLSFFPVSHCFRGWSKKNLKIYDVINCLNKNLMTHFDILRKK